MTGLIALYLFLGLIALVALAWCAIWLFIFVTNKMRSVTVAVSETTVFLGHTVQVNIKATRSLKSDMVRVTAADASGPVRPVSASVLKAAEFPVAGSLALDLSVGPFLQPGSYTIHFSTVEGQSIGSSETIVVQLPTVTMPADPVYWYEAIVVQFGASAQHLPTDKLVLRSAADPDDALQTLPVPAGAATGSVTFSGVLPGSYVVSYMSALRGAVEALVTSACLQVKGPTVKLESSEETPTGVYFWRQALRVQVRTSAAHHRKDYLVLATLPARSSGAYPSSQLSAPDGAVVEQLSRVVNAPDGPYMYLPQGDISPSIDFTGSKVPKWPGWYVLFYVDGARSGNPVLCFSDPFVIHGPTIRVVKFGEDSEVTSLASEEVQPFWGEPIDVQLITSPQRSAYDLVCLCREGELPGHGSTSHTKIYVPQPPKNQPTADPCAARVTFDERHVTKVPGSYRIAYMPDGNESKVMYSAPFTVRGPRLWYSSGPARAADSGKYDVPDNDPGAPDYTEDAGYWGESVGCSYETSTRHAEDLVALALEGQAPQVTFGLALWGYPKGLMVKLPPIAHRGMVHFEGVNAPPYPGTWQFVYMSQVDGHYMELARSHPFRVRSPMLELALLRPGGGLGDAVPVGERATPPRAAISFHASPLHSNSDWIALARRGGEPYAGATATSYNWVPVGPTGTVLFEPKHMPQERGEYEACYILAKPYDQVVARSNVFLIEITPDGTRSAVLAPRLSSNAWMPTGPMQVPDNTGPSSPVDGPGASIAKTTSSSSMRAVGQGRPDDIPEGNPVQLTPSPSPTPAPAPAPSGIDLSEFEKMQRLGVPPPALRLKMEARGVPANVINEFLGEAAPAPAPAPRRPTPAPAPAAGPAPAPGSSPSEPSGAGGSGLSAAALASAGARLNSARSPPITDPATLTLSTQRLQQIELAVRKMSGIRFGPDAGQRIKAAVMSLDIAPFGGDPSLLEKLVPSSAESAFLTYAGPRTSLSAHQLLLLELGSIRRMKERIEVLSFRAACAEKVDQIRDAMTQFTAAFNQVLDARDLLEISEAVTVPGSHKPALAALLELKRLTLADAASSSMCPLDAVLMDLRERHGESGNWMTLETQFSAVRAAAKLSYSGIATQLSGLEAGFQMAISEAAQCTDAAEEQSFAAAVRSAFTPAALQELQAARTKLETLCNKVLQLTAGGDVSSALEGLIRFLDKFAERRGVVLRKYKTARGSSSRMLSSSPSPAPAAPNAAAAPAPAAGFGKADEEPPVSPPVAVRRQSSRGTRRSVLDGASTAASLAEDAKIDLSRFEKMKRIGSTPTQIRLAMEQAGVPTDIIDAFCGVADVPVRRAARAVDALTSASLAEAAAHLVSPKPRKATSSAPGTGFVSVADHMMASLRQRRRVVAGSSDSDSD